MSKWESKRLSEIEGCQIIMGQSPSSETYNLEKKGLPFIQGKAEFGYLYPTPIQYTSNPIKIADEGDILISVRAPVGDVNLCPMPICIGRGIAALRITKQIPKYFYYWFQWKKDYLQSQGMGSTFKAVTVDQLKKLEISVPPVEEQRSITKILNSIDEAIQKTDEAINHTEKLKSALMQQLLTKGIGHTEFKDSKIGRIPKDWESTTLSQLVKTTIGGGTPSTKEEKYWDGDIEWMTSANIQNKEVFAGQKKITQMGLENSATNLVEKDNLLIATRVGIGKLAVNRIDIAISQDLTGLIIKKDLIDEMFLLWWLISRQHELKSLAQGSTIKGILKTDLLQLTIPLPNKKEQQEIIKRLNSIDERMNLIMQRKTCYENLKEQLMNDLLSGKKEIKTN